MLHITFVDESGFQFSLDVLLSLQKSEAGTPRKNSGNGMDGSERSLPRPQSGTINQSSSQASLPSAEGNTNEAQRTDNQPQQQPQSRPKEKPKVKKDRMPKVTLQSVIADDNVAVCMFDTFKGVKITFKFGIHDDEPEEVGDKMVC